MPPRILPFFVLLLAVTMTSISAPPAQADHPPLDRAIKRQQTRQGYIKLETFIASLGITPGMSILDIGAGPGYASFLFAEKLQGSGAVYATDIRADFVKHIADDARKKGLTNLSSALVKEEGLDDFYLKHRYDLAFLSNAYHCLDNRVAYFSRLRSVLNQNARLVLILINQVPLFSVDDLTRFDDLVKSLAAEADDNPFVRNLSITTRQLLRTRGTDERLKNALVEDFNRMLVDPRFYRHFYNDSYFKKDFFNVPERDFANWLLMTLQEEGVLDRTDGQINAKAMRTVIKLNRLFFIKRFGSYLAKDGMGAYLPAGDANRHTSKYVMLRELDAAGYTFAEEIKLSPYYDAVIMVPKGH